MKITPYLHMQAPELCYFTVNGIRYTEKPGLGLQCNWYRLMTDRKADHPITAIRAKHFKKAQFVKYAEIKLIYPKGFEWLNVQGKQRFISYGQLITDLNEWLAKKHPSYFDHNMELFDGSIMPVPKLIIKTKSCYVV